MTSLESVVLQLQDSCREARSESADLRQENGRLLHALESHKHESREREQFLRNFWHSKKGAGHDPSIDDLPPPPATFASVPQPNAGSSSLGSAHLSQVNAGPYAGSSSLQDGLRYSTHSDPSATLGASSYHSGTSGAYADRSPSLSFINHDVDAVTAHGRPLDPQRLAKMGHYYNMQGAIRDTGWPPEVTPSSSGGDPGHPDSAGSSHSPGFLESPNMTTTDMPYVHRFPAIEEQKANLPTIETAPYMFDSNRSMSPTNSSPHTGSSTSISSNFQFVFPSEQERPDHEYRRHTTHGAEVTLHGGTADVSSYALGQRRLNTGPERPMLGGVSSYNPVDIERPRPVRAGSDGGSSQARRSRRHSPISPSARASRSPSPGMQAPISSTLAVIKAQAFGALRRTRVRPKKASDGAAKAAMEVLEARGIGLGVGMGSGSGQKRQRLHGDEDMHS